MLDRFGYDYEYCTYYEESITKCVAKHYGRKLPIHDGCLSCPMSLRDHAPINQPKDRLFRCKPKDMVGQMDILSLKIEDDNDRGCPQGGFSWDNPGCVRCFQLQKRDYAKKSCGSYYNKTRPERNSDTHKRRKRTLKDVKNRRLGITWGNKYEGNSLYDNTESGDEDED